MPGLILAATDVPSPLMRDLVVILAAAAVVAVVLQRLRMATVPAYLITGTLIGPGALGFISDDQNVRVISDLAIILLLFGVGLHMDLSVLARGMKQMTLATLLSFSLCTLALWPLMLVLDTSAAGGLVVAAALSFSSTVIVLRILMQRKELSHPEGRLAFGVLILQDLLAIIMLLLLPPLAKWAGTGTVAVEREAGLTGIDFALGLIASGLVAIGGIGLLIGFGRYVLPRLLTEAARGRSSEVLIVLTTASALGAAALTQYLIHNAAVGAFLAGFLLSTTPFRHQVSGQVGAIRDLFSAVFFTAVGMSVSLIVLWDNWILIVIGTLVMIAIKGALMTVSFWMTGATGNVALKAGWSLSQSGEFGLLMLASASAASIGLVSTDIVGKGAAVTVISLILTPMLVQFVAGFSGRLPRIPPPRWARRWTVHRSDQGGGVRGVAGGALPGSPLGLHAIIAGFGLVGRTVADELRSLGATSTVVDLNPATIATQRRLGREIVFGDVSSEEVLEQAGIHRADLLILTIPDEESVLRACRIARQMKPGIFIIARANYVSQGVVAAGMGADGVVVEEMATALEMERMLKKVLDARRQSAAAAPATVAADH